MKQGKTLKEKTMKLYQTVWTNKNSYDEFLEYEGTDKAMALITKEDLERSKKVVEVREYDLEKPWEEMDEDERSEVLCGDYNLVK